MRKIKLKEYTVIDGQRVALTPWFDADVKPVPPGVYECRRSLRSLNRNVPLYRGWDGQRWYYGGSSRRGAAQQMGTKLALIRIRSHMQQPWRGLANPQEQK